MPGALPGSTSISADPQLLDAFHLATTSPCRSSGSPLQSVGVDLDGDEWLNPPAIGCDEVVEAALVGPLAVSIESAQDNCLVNHALGFTGRITGRAARLEWGFGDSPAITNASYIASHAWISPGDYTVTFTAFNADNPAGVSTNLAVRVLPLAQPQLQSVAMASNTFSFSFSGQTNANYYVEMATNLNSPITWRTLKSLTSTGGVIQITDATATNEARFYRVRAQ